VPAFCQPPIQSSDISRMIIWIDAQLSPDLGKWISENFGVDAKSLRDLGLRDAQDQDIFKSAREAKAVVMSKDADFISLLEQHGAPPQILWVTCGNTSNAHLKKVLKISMPQAIEMLNNGEILVEISDPYEIRD
jgi:predicted nuclease of predicted toxin-antitoxin system